MFPMCLCPSTDNTDAALTWFQSENVHIKQVADIFVEIYDVHDSTATFHYTFSEDALQNLTSLEDDFIREVNDAIQNGNVPPKSKKIDLLQRVAISLHVFNFVTDELLQGWKQPTVPMQISLETLQQAIHYVEYTETQKEIVMEVSRCIHIDEKRTLFLMW